MFSQSRGADEIREEDRDRLAGLLARSRSALQSSSTFGAELGPILVLLAALRTNNHKGQRTPVGKREQAVRTCQPPPIGRRRGLLLARDREAHVAYSRARLAALGGSPFSLPSQRVGYARIPAPFLHNSPPECFLGAQQADAVISQYAIGQAELWHQQSRQSIT